MPKIIVEIEYDEPKDPYWLNPENVDYCLRKVCTKTEFKVKWAKNGDPWKKEKQ